MAAGFRSSRIAAGPARGPVRGWGAEGYESAARMAGRNPMSRDGRVGGRRWPESARRLLCGLAGIAPKLRTQARALAQSNALQAMS